MIPVFVGAADGAPYGMPARLSRCRWWCFHVFLACLFLLPCMAQAAGAVQSSRLPARKAGLWEVTVQAYAADGPGSAMQPAFTVQQCTNAAAEPVMLLALLPGQENCTEPRVAKRNGQGGGYDITTECRSDGRPVRGHLMLWGDLQGVYSGEFSVSYPQTPRYNVGPAAFQGRWLGDCKPGQKPGQMVLPNGITVNPAEDAARVKEHGHE